jgi:predicted kinase
MGAPGSGKSTLGRALSRALHWPVIDKDDVRDLLDDATPDAGGLAYAVMFNVARRQLLHGVSVICDSPFAYRRCYDRAVEIVQETGAALAVVECRCSDEAAWRQRVEARQVRALPRHHTTDWAAVLAFQQRSAADAGYPIVHPHLIVDTLTPVPALCAHIVTWLEQQAVR